MFCPKCGSIMMPKKIDGKTAFSCACGHSNATGSLKIGEKISEKKDMEVVEEKMDGLPTIDETCKKCGHGKAYFWTKQTRASDEPETKFIRCQKCGFTWRDYK